ncbi:MAG: TonB-dependent receptor [candidate division KSB1 bacterium]|nr:TonB-dependent receptor [candidate division KSB1 bacterium]MDZ7302769.1 TonB-dependent receptor [candidate division KSB1 bacterium]MDZ7310066.1 TonB-dependent receptor [candidate division KSB1 bacterium]
MQRHKLIALLVNLGMMACLTALGLAQEIILSGTVRDINTYREIRGVNIYLEGTSLGTASDYSGRYVLRVPGTARRTTVVFRHVAYEPREIPLDSLATIRYVYLQPRIITLGEIEIQAAAPPRSIIDRDLPQTLSVIEAKNFEIRGYVDAGDLLRTDHSVQVEEELSGKKTVTIRGGNPDEVVVLYNGIKMNSVYDNVFDLSLIDLEDIDRLEIIKGSNTALYGPEAFSGVINIVPKLQEDYHFRFQQRFGTYRSGNWGLQLHQGFNRLHGSYSLKRGGVHRVLSGAAADSSRLENTALHHTANLSYSFSERTNGEPANTLSAMYVYSDLDYDNQRDVERVSDLNRLLSLKYTGDVAVLKNVDLALSWRRLSEEQSLRFANALHRRLDDRAIYIDAQKRLQMHRAEMVLAYQFQNSTLDFTDERTISQQSAVGLEAVDLSRQQHGVVAIARFHGEAGSDFFRTMDFDLSFRHDRVHDEQSNALQRGPAGGGQLSTSGIFQDHDWQESMLKAAVRLLGYRKDFVFSGYLSFGKNAKFPTLLQQISTPDLSSSRATRPHLSPERNRSVELGIELTRDIRERTSIYGWQLSGNFFQNDYDNKFRMFAVPTIPIAFYDNVLNARISGVETKASAFLLRKKLTFELGLSRYFISDKAAFPFKSDFKLTVGCNVDHAGYALQLLWFKESEQLGWLRLPPNNIFAQIALPAQTNVDFHLSKTFEIGKLELFANFSGRNLLNDQVILQGLALRDRRFYLTAGAQY